MGRAPRVAPPGRPGSSTALAVRPRSGLRCGGRSPVPTCENTNFLDAGLALRKSGRPRRARGRDAVGSSSMTSSVTREPASLRIDLHAHTRFSPDATMSPRELVDRALDAGLDRIAVTDHGEIEGALEARAYAPAHVIVGEEIRCEGRTELIGLFLTERIPQGLPIEETVERIRAQGGLVYAPHPYAYARR